MSEAAVHNGVIYLAGQVAWRQTAPDIEGQTEEARAFGSPSSGGEIRAVVRAGHWSACVGSLSGRQNLQLRRLQVLAAVDKLLASNGSDKRRLLMVSVFLAEMGHFQRFNAVYDAWMLQCKGHAPPRATVRSGVARRRAPLSHLRTVTTD